jgi:hypothetical protein
MAYVVCRVLVSGHSNMKTYIFKNTKYVPFSCFDVFDCVFVFLASGVAVTRVFVLCLLGANGVSEKI